MGIGTMQLHNRIVNESIFMLLSCVNPSIQLFHCKCSKFKTFNQSNAKRSS